MDDGGGGDSFFRMNVSEDGRCAARTSLAIKFIFSFGDGSDEGTLIIGVDVQTGRVFVERMGDGVCREQLI